MTCKDCIHSKVCRYSAQPDICFGGCSLFKAKYWTIEFLCKVGDMIDVLFSHYETVSLWVEDKDNHCSNLLWHGVAWKIPDYFKILDYTYMEGNLPNDCKYCGAIMDKKTAT